MASLLVLNARMNDPVDPISNRFDYLLLFYLVDGVSTVSEKSSMACSRPAKRERAQQHHVSAQDGPMTNPQDIAQSSIREILSTVSWGYTVWTLGPALI